MARPGLLKSVYLRSRTLVFLRVEMSGLANAKFPGLFLRGK